MPFNLEVYQVPEGEKHPGTWTFRLNEKESHFYSSSEAGIMRKIARHMRSRNGAVSLQPVMTSVTDDELGTPAAPTSSPVPTTTVMGLEEYVNSQQKAMEAKLERLNGNKGDQ